MEERAAEKAIFAYGFCASVARSSDRQQLLVVYACGVSSIEQYSSQASGDKNAQHGSMGLNWIRERRRSSDKEVVQRKKVVNPDTGETPAGYNKMLRDCARIALAAASATLLLGWPQIALVASAIAAGLLQQGTTYSIKNWKWTAVSWCLLPACLTAWFLRSTAGMIDPDRGYSIYIIFVMVGRFTEFAAGSTVAIFLAFALAAPPDKSGEAR